MEGLTAVGAPIVVKAGQGIARSPKLPKEGGRNYEV